jgi:hypothetical protein
MIEPERPGGETPLNPVLKSRTETTHDLATSPPPVETASAHVGGGEGWPIAWLLVAVAGILLALYFIL